MAARCGPLLTSAIIVELVEANPLGHLCSHKAGLAKVSLR
jgi:hypothetical protein